MRLVALLLSLQYVHISSDYQSDSAVAVTKLHGTLPLHSLFFPRRKSFQNGKIKQIFSKFQRAKLRKSTRTRIILMMSRTREPSSHHMPHATCIIIARNRIIFIIITYTRKYIYIFIPIIFFFSDSAEPLASGHNLLIVNDIEYDYILLYHI